MKYYLVEQFENGEHTAWDKARADAEIIAEKSGFQPMCISALNENRSRESKIKKLFDHFKIKRHWKQTFKAMQKGDELLIQIPVINNCIFLGSVFKNLKKRGIKVILLVHDLEVLRISNEDCYTLMQKFRIRTEELNEIKQASRLIVHNEKMRKYIEKIGVNTEMTELGIFDYLVTDSYDGVSIEEHIQKRNSNRNDAVIVAGNLSKEKSGYLYNVDADVKLELYGGHYCENRNSNLHYNGSFPSDVLPYMMCNGFGLIWDGESTETCSGIFGEYLKYNNPHKTSLYLASGYPVIIWEQAALADFIKENGVGITVSSLKEIPEKLSQLTDDDYKKMCANVLNISKKLREGSYLQSALLSK